MHHPIRIRALRLGLAACLLAGALAGLASANAPTYETTILFTHDTHDHFLPMPDEEGGEYGGYTRLATLIQQERAAHPDALVLDAGDFSMGSLFQTIYATEAPELRALGAMGYDATTLGNHEFDYRARGLAEMLNAAVDSGDPVPPIVQANYKPPAEDADTWAAWNPHRMMFNKVTDCAQVLPDGSAVPIDDDRLYRVVTGLYTGQMLGTVNDQSFGILAITPKDAQGNVITDYEEHIIYNPNGSEVKEWYALASYLQSMGEVDGRYAAPEGRKVEHATWNPLSLLKNLNLFGWLAVLAAVLVLAAVVFLVWRLCFHHRRGRYGGRRRGGGYRPYRG